MNATNMKYYLKPCIKVIDMQSSRVLVGSVYSIDSNIDIIYGGEDAGIVRSPMINVFHE